ncbi:agaA33 [Symbiodinium sp. CCMP2592]|nr:agaA33 [Symbiodinium sp. CCMP2592]
MVHPPVPVRCNASEPEHDGMLKRLRVHSGCRTCALEGLLGTGLDEDDRVLVMDTCGSPNVVPLFPSAGLSQEVGSSGAYVSWGNAVITSKGGAYRLCWCSRDLNTSYSENASDPECSVPTAFGVDFGTPVLRGPAELAKPLYCILGDDCVMQPVSGMYTSALDWVRVLDTCGIPAQQPAYQAAISPSDGMKQVFGAESHSSVIVPAAGIPAAGGQYRLCWCGHESNCLAAASYRVDFGSISLAGPLQGQFRTCVSGHSCVVSSILGYDLSNETSFLVMDTCGQSGAVQGAAMNSRNATQGRCDSSLSFKVNFGGLIMRGPSPLSQTFTCIAGHPCRFDGVRGQDLSFADQYLMLDTCSRSRLASDALDARMTFSEQPLSSSLQSDGVVLVPGGQYRLCWCGGAGTANSSHHLSCSLPTDYLVDFASISVIGPSSFDQDKTCIAGMSCAVRNIEGYFTSSGSGLMLPDAPVNSTFRWLLTSTSAQGGQYRLCSCADGQVCSTMEHFTVDVGAFSLLGPMPIQQAFTCVAGRECNIDPITGFHLDENRLVVLETCGSERGVLRIPNSGLALASGGAATWGPLPLTAAGGQYRLCWCADLVMKPINESNHTSRGCGIFSDYTYDIGSLSILGPMPLVQSRTCVSGHNCQLDGFTGHGLSNLDKLLVNPPPWCQDGAWRQFCTHHAGDFAVDMGAMWLLGRLQDRTCISGQTCSSSGMVATTGGGVFVSGRIHVLDTCGLVGFLERFPAGGLSGEVRHVKGIVTAPLAGDLLDVRGMSVVSWTAEALTVSAGQYRLCWCALLPGPTNISSCILTSEFSVDFGALDLYGPLPGHRRTCVCGYTCSFGGIAGYGLSQNDTILVMETCGSSDSPLSLEWLCSPDLCKWVSHELGGDSYRLCWCSQSGSCRRPESFPFDFGELLLVGPVQVDHTCVAGQTCYLDGLPRTWSEVNSYMILETCGIADTLLSVITASPVLSAQGQANWGGSPLTSADLRAGIYQLCWCYRWHADDDWCQRYGSLGRTLDLRPSRSIRRVSGHLCRPSAGIEHANSSDSVGLRYEVLAMDTCGGVSVPGGFPLQWSSNSSWNATAGSLLSASMQELTTAPGGTYRLCWAGPASLGAPAASPWTWSRSAGVVRVALEPEPEPELLICGVAKRRSSWGPWAPQPGPGASASAQDAPRGEISEFFRVDLGRFLVLGPSLIRQPFAMIPEVHRSAPGVLSISWGTAALVQSGPAPLQQQFTCLAGQRCSLENLSGYGMSDAGVLLVMDTCGIASTTLQFAPGEPEGLLSDYVLLTDGSYRLCWCALLGSSNSSGCDLPASFLTVLDLQPHSLTVSWREDALSTPGGQYRLCWCATGARCQDASSLRVDFMSQLEHMEIEGERVTWGNLQFSAAGGAFRLCWCAGNSTCLVPEDFRLDIGQLLLIGSWFWTRARNLETQLNLTDELRGSTYGPLMNFELAGYISAQGARYRLCWCGAQAACSSSEDFYVDFGELQLLGPSLGQSQTCVSGQACFLKNLLGHHVPDGEGAIFDTCGVRGVALEGVHISQALASAPAHGSGVLLSTLTASGGAITDVSCASSSSNLGYLLHEFIGIGRFTLQGPAPLQQDRTCIASQECEVDALTGGRSLVLFLDPVNEVESATVQGFARPWQALQSEAVPIVLVWAQAAGAIEATKAWAPKRLLVSEPAHFPTTCIAGRTCNAERIRGQSLSASDRLQILATCGGTVPLRFPMNGLILHLNASQPPSGMGLGSEIVSAPGGLYRLCWCSGLTPSGCLRGTDFQTDLGAMAILGSVPSSKTERSSAAEYGLWILCWGLSESDCYMILDTCGQAVTTVGIGKASFSSHPRISWADSLTAAGGEYRLCWCSGLPSPSTDDFNTSKTSSMTGNVSVCSVSWDFGIDAGKLLLLGPAPLFHRSTCAAGQTCAINVAGTGLSSADLLLVQDTCGQLFASTPFASPSSLRLSSYNSSNINASFLDATRSATAYLGRSVTAGEYRQCWCQRMSNMSDCRVDHSDVDFGVLQIFGPTLQQDRTCVSSMACQISGIEGTGLGSGDCLMLLETCSSGAMLDALPAVPSSTLSGSSFDWTANLTEILMSSPGGLYRLCWCMRGYPCDLIEHFVVYMGALHVIGSFRLCWCVEKLPQNLTNYTSCAISSDFTVDRGMLHVMGPLAGDTQQQFTCVGGQRCTLSPIRGLHLLSGDRVLVMDTCGVQEMPANVSGTFGVGGLRNSVLVWDVEEPKHVHIKSHFQNTCGLQNGCWWTQYIIPRIASASNVCQWTNLLPGRNHWLLLVPERCNHGLDTCGAPSGVINMLATAAVVSHSGAAARWDAAVVTAAGGIYRLCWCAGLRVEEGFTNSSSCRTPVGFTADFGDLHLIGPNPLDATRTCISGPCVTAALEGFHLSVHDRFVILDTCGQRLAVVAGAGLAFLQGQHVQGTFVGMAC